MADPRWMGPPEVVAALFEVGPGPASVLANQLVWVVEAISHELAIAMSAANTAATATQWMGAGGAASGQSAAGLNSGLQTLVGWITHKVAITQAAADAYLIAASAVIPSTVSQANRDETAALHATNFLGVNTPAIIERDTEYFGEHWPHNSSVGWTYSSALTGLIGTLGVPPPAAPAGAAPGAAMTAGLAESGVQTAGSGGLQAAMQAGEASAAPAQAPAALAGQLGSALQHGQQLVGASTQALRGFSSSPQALMGMFSAFKPTGATGADPGLAGAVAEPVRAGGGVAGGVTGGAGSAAGGGYPGGALTSYTRPASTFTPENGGRPAGRAGVLNAAELRGPTSSGGAAMPLTAPARAAGMLGRANAGEDRHQVAHSRIVVASGAGKA